MFGGPGPARRKRVERAGLALRLQPFVLIGHDFARRASDHVLEFVQFDEVVGLTAQIIGNHRRLAADGRYHRHAHALALQAFDQRAEIAIA